MTDTSSPTGLAPLLVCAPSERRPEPQVVVADGSYETGEERVFWRHSPQVEVLRIALEDPVSVRPLHRVPVQRAASSGEQRLLAALAPHRSGASRGEHAVPRDRLTAALQEGRTTDAEDAARLLRRRAGLASVHDVVSASLAAAGERWASGQTAVLTVRRQVVAARTLLERLRDDVLPVGRGLVVLAVPPGDQHTLALTALAHQLEEAGYETVVVDDLPEDELLELAADPGTLGVVLSVHLEVPARVTRRLLTALRDAAPHVLLAVGGPGRPDGARPADLVTDDPAELLRALAGRRNPLTEREVEVLLAVADGLTNNEIAAALGVSSATVKSHIDHVLTKSGTEHRAAAVARALRQGWIT